MKWRRGWRCTATISRPPRGGSGGRGWRNRRIRRQKEVPSAATVSQLISRAAVSSTNINSRRRTRTGSSQLRLRLRRQWAQPTSLEKLYERAINHFKPPPTMPFSYDAEVERLRRELALAGSAKIESERMICILRDQIVVHQARQLNQLQQQHQHEQHGCSHLLEQWQDMGFGFYGNRVLGSNPFRTAGKTVKN